MCDKAVHAWNKFLRSNQTIFLLKVLTLMFSPVQHRLSGIVPGFINAFCSFATSAESHPIQLRRIVTDSVGRGDHSMGGDLANLAARPATYLAPDIVSVGRSGDLIGSETLLKDLNLEMARVSDAVIALCEEVVP